MAFNIRMIKKVFFVFFILASILPGRSLNFVYAEINMMSENFDYSSLSEEEKKEEADLIYKYAKKSYLDGDIETAKTLFYHVLELEPYHEGANKYIDEIIPKKLSLDKYIKAKEMKVILDKKEEMEFKNLENSIEAARKQMDTMEKERLTREALYKSQLNKLEKDVIEKEKAKKERITKAKEKAEKKKQAKLEQQRIINEKKELKRKKKEDIIKAKKIKEEKENILPFTDQQLTEDSLKAVKDKEQISEEKLVKEIDSRRGTSWKMIGRELDNLEKENKRLHAIKEKERRRKELKEKKDKAREVKRARRVEKLEARKKKREEKIAKKKEKQEKKEVLKKKREESKLNKKPEKQKIQQKKEDTVILNEDKVKETDAVLQRHRRRMEAALKKKTKDSQVKALYEEGVYCYKNKKYSLAEDAFNKALEINPNHVKTLDYLYIHIPEAKSTPE